MHLLHFSENASILRFEPRPVRTPAKRPVGKEWLNGPLVWAIDEDHQHLCLFPRECPRVVMWATDDTTEEDRKAWLEPMPAGMRALAFIERCWLERLARATVFRYELPRDSFIDIEDVGMHVSRSVVVPSGSTGLTDLRSALGACRVHLQVLDSLLPLKTAWASSLHVSGIRLRNAIGWK
ncbi:DUF6886 family protein [Variovorax saccharolyticus]|uniref:DUF6886 family protein n=1 Tax=Variovorax saccharolyticus TaxID=3053516 RepID=UPI002574F9C3|nr:DUF6886 family protein [Variovorax sp. J31P216]MDM0028425.1 hypothetical protein [Variovorax sp. J31P216]